MIRHVAPLSLALLLLLPAFPLGAQEDPRATLFAGYSYMRAQQEGAADGNLHGLQVGYTYYGIPRVGFKVSGGAHWGDVDAPPNILNSAEYAARHLTLLAGPRLVLWRNLSSEAGLDLLGGAMWRRFQTAVSSIAVADEVSVAGTVQLSLDFRLSDQIWLRAAQPSVLWTRFGGRTQVDYRLSAGLVLRAGEILR